MLIGLGRSCDLSTPRQDETVVFNTFVLMQCWNEFNAHVLGDDFNPFKHGLKNPLFWIVLVITIGMQIFIVQVGGLFTQTAALSARHWLGCIVFGFTALPFGTLLRLIPVPDASEPSAAAAAAEKAAATTTTKPSKA